MQGGWRGTVTLVTMIGRGGLIILLYSAMKNSLHLCSRVASPSHSNGVVSCTCNFFRRVQEDSYSPPSPCCCYLVSGRSF